MKLVQECSFKAMLRPPVPIGAGLTGMRMGTGDPRYAWVNTAFFVGEGRVLPGLGVEYRVWRPA